MKKLAAIAWVLLSAVAVRSADPVLQPVADPGPILQDLQRKMSSLDPFAFASISLRPARFARSASFRSFPARAAKKGELS